MTLGTIFAAFMHVVETKKTYAALSCESVGLISEMSLLVQRSDRVLMCEINAFAIL